MHIEPPEADAADAVADLWVALAAEQRDHGSHLLAAENRTAIREAILRHAVTGGLLVARAEADDLLGFVMFGPESGSYEQDVARGIVHNLYVRPERRNEGVGGALLEAAEDALRRDGAEVVALESMADNEHARRFYRRHGYEPHRVEMEKPLGGQSDTHSRERE